MFKKKDCKQILPEIVLVSAALAFMLCVFGSLSVYFGNSSEFWFGIKELLPTSIVTFLVSCLVLLGISISILKMGGGYIWYSVLLGGLLYFYIQGNFIPRNYGVLDGRIIDWGNYSGYAWASIILFLICVIIIVVLSCLNKVLKWGRCICVFVLGIQIITLGTLFVQNIDCLEKNNTVVTSKAAFDLSKEKNVLIFVLDTFDSQYMQDILNGDKSEKYTDLFRGFTFYPDTLGMYPNTNGALPHILTGVKNYNSLTFSEYVQAAYASTDIWSNMEKEGFSVGVYSTNNYVNLDDTNLVNVQEGKLIVKDNLLFAKSIFQMVFFQYMPHQIKRFFIVDSSALENDKKLEYEDDQDGLWSWYSYKFYNDLKQYRINVTKDAAVFRFYHFDGVHPEYVNGAGNGHRYGIDLKVDGNNHDVYDQAYGNLRMLEEYFKQLKDLGIWDNSSIIVMADHGELDKRQNPMFMIKNANSSGTFKISNEKMSYDYLAEVFNELISGKKVDDSVIRRMFVDSGERREYLYYVHENIGNNEYLPKIMQFYLDRTGDARDAASLEFANHSYAEGEEISLFNDYYLGTNLNIGDKNVVDTYCLYGVPTPEGWGSWTDGKVVLFGMKIPNMDGQYISLKIRCIPYNPPQHVEISFNGHSVYKEIIEKDTTIEAIIPCEFIEDENTIKLYLPDAISPHSLGESLNDRQLALALYSMQLSAIDLSYAREHLHIYDIDNQVFFGEEETVSTYCLHGIPFAEGWGSWTDGNEVLFEFKIDDWDGNDVVMNLHCIPYNPPQNVEILANGNQVYINDISEDTNIETIIPSSFIEDGVVRLQMNLPNAVSPKSRGESADERELALALYEFKMASLSDVDEAVKNTHYYSLGTSLEFGEENSEGNKYCTSGLSNPEKSGTWSDDEVVSFDFDIDAVGKDLNLTMGYGTYGKQRILVYANEKLLEEYEFDGWEEHSFVIPEEIYDKTITIRIELPNASSPKENGESEDDRILGINISSIKIE